MSSLKFPDIPLTPEEVSFALATALYSGKQAKEIQAIQRRERKRQVRTAKGILRTAIRKHVDDPNTLNRILNSIWRILETHSLTYWPEMED